MEVVERRLDMYQRPVLGHSESWPHFVHSIQGMAEPDSLKAGHGAPYRGDQFGDWAVKYTASRAQDQACEIC